MSCLCTPASFTIIMYLLSVNISQLSPETICGRYLLATVSSPMRPWDSTRSKSVPPGKYMAVETASGYHLKQPIPLGWCRSFWIACSSQAPPTCCSGMRFINKLVDFPAVVKLACEICPCLNGRIFLPTIFCFQDSFVMRAMRADIKTEESGQQTDILSNQHYHYCNMISESNVHLCILSSTFICWLIFVESASTSKLSRKCAHLFN